ncbi:ComEA family DNA-binding protein [Curtobacterium pusillum]|uniref:ComEA family DNA-binding protein n=1 Tax=Curtobacterium pusillum TaxID=69373 RepID=UPI0011A0AAE3|nr:ComEA family DNA-binding protein [Curtobacterium pusillum]
MTSGSGSGSRFAALALSPRAAVVLAAVVVVAALVVVLLGSRSGIGADGATVSVTGGPSAVVATPSASSTPAGVVVVHVVGAVQRAGVVSLGAGSRVSVAIDRAGGATPDADLARLNLARVVVDGERLYVPKVGETEVPAALGDGAAVAGPGGAESGSDGGDAIVDLNSADQAALETLPGIGPSLAGRILAWREEHGRFGSVEDLLDVSGIGDGRLADLRDRVRV